MPKNTPQRIIDISRGVAGGGGAVLYTPGGGGTGGSGSDHGLLTGLSDDDHPQYFNTARGDARYVPLTRSIIAGAGLAGGGALAGDVTLAVGAGAGIVVNADDVAVAPTIAGPGLTYTPGLLAVGAGPGITVNDNDVALTTPGTLSVASANNAVGSHTHAIMSSSNPGAAAAILASDTNGYLSLVRLITSDRVRTSLLDTASGAMTLQPATDVLLQPASNLVKLQSGVNFQSHNYASQTIGMRITNDGQGDFRYLFTDELHAKSFITDLEQALAGGQIISKSVAVLAANFTAPVAGGTATLRVKDLPSAANMAVFQTNDIVRVRSFNRSGGSLYISDCWGAVTGYTDQPDGSQTWTFTRSAAPNAGAMAAGTVVEADALVLDYGVSGNGLHEVNAIDGLYGANSPYSQIVTWLGHPATGQSVRTRLGNLYGIFGQVNEFGLFAGNGASNTDSYLRVSNSAARFNNIPIQLWNGTNQTVNISSNGMDIWVGPSSADRRLTWNGSLLSVTGAIYVTGGNAATYDNVTGAINLVRNSSFEVDANADGLADGFNVYNNDGGGVPTAASLVAGVKSTKAQRIGWSGTNLTSKGIFFSTGTRRANVTYMLTFWARASAPVELNVYFNTQPASKTDIIHPTADTTWRFFAFCCTWAADVVDFWYLSILYGHGLANAYVEFDNVMVYEGDSILPYAPSPQDTIGYGGLVNMPAAPGAAGLYMTSAYMGHWNGSAWKTWMDSGGNFYFGGSSGASIRWNGTTLGGYNSNNEPQWYASSADGKLYAGAGHIVMGAAGFDIGYWGVYNNVQYNDYGRWTWYTSPATRTGKIAEMWLGDDDAVYAGNIPFESRGHGLHIKGTNTVIPSIYLWSTTGGAKIWSDSYNGAPTQDVAWRNITANGVLSINAQIRSSNVISLRNAADTAYQTLVALHVAPVGDFYKDAAFRFLTNSGAAQYLHIGGLLASNDFGHAIYVPTNGIYSLGDIITGNNLVVGHRIKPVAITYQPSIPSGNVEMFIYNDPNDTTKKRFVIAYNHSGTVKYRWMDLDGAVANWLYSTTWSDVVN